MGPALSGGTGGGSGEKAWARSLVVPRQGSYVPGRYSGGVANFGLRHAQDLVQTKQERRSRLPTQDFRTGPRGIIEPPYDLDTLVDLLSSNPDYYRVVDQFATDVAGRGWKLVDVEDPLSALSKPNEDPAAQLGADMAAVIQRIEAKKRFETFGRDFNGQSVPLQELSKQTIFDYDGTGDGYIEVARNAEDEKIAAGFHLPSRLVRKRWDGGFVQIDETGREVAFFRPFGSSPDDPLSRHTREEAKLAGVDEGDLKNELKNFRKYHSAELYYGVPPIIAALAHLYGNIFSEARNVRYFYNRALPDWLVTMRASRATFNDDGTNAILDQYEQAILEHMNYVIQGQGDYRTLILKLPTGEVEMAWEKLDTGLDDKDFLLGYRSANRDVIIGVYRMPPEKVGIIEAASLGTGTGETQQESYKRGQIDPRQEMLESFFDAVLDDWSYNLVRFEYEDIDIIDEQREMQLFAVASASGSLAPNEEREWLSRIVKDQDFPPLDEDLMDLPKWLVEQQTAGLLAGAMMEEERALPAPRVPEEELGGLAGPVISQLEGTNGGEGRPMRLPTSMTRAVDPAYARIARDISRRMREQVAERRRVLLEAAGLDARGGKIPQMSMPVPSGAGGDTDGA